MNITQAVERLLDAKRRIKAQLTEIDRLLNYDALTSGDWCELSLSGSIIGREGDRIDQIASEMADEAIVDEDAQD